MNDNERFEDPYSNDEEPTVKMIIPPHVLARLRKGSSRRPGVGMVLCITFGVAFWAFVLHLMGWF